jgi:hypothetical protein
MEGDEFDRVRSIALALPGVTERISHGEPCFFVQEKRPLCYFHDNHRGDGRIRIVRRCLGPKPFPAKSARKRRTASGRMVLMGTVPNAGRMWLLSMLS